MSYTTKQSQWLETLKGDHINFITDASDIGFPVSMHDWPNSIIIETENFGSIELQKSVVFAQVRAHYVTASFEAVVYND